MTAWQRWLATAIGAITVAATILTASGNRWFDGALAAVVLAVAFAFLCRRAGAGRRRWAVSAAILSLSAGIVLYIAKTSVESACMGFNASGERVVIGTEFTEKGRKYHEANPNEDNNAILGALGGMGPQEAWTADSIARCRLKLIATGALWMPLFGVALVCAVALMTTPADPGRAARRGKKNVFISYNHGDAATAVRLRDALARSKLAVILDVDGMTAGQRIQDFIEESIRDSDTVVSIVSSSSLLSSWVAMETIHSLQRQKWVEGKQFIACYLSDDFFQPEFRLECTRRIDERLAVLDGVIHEYQEKKIDPVDLSEEKTRLYELRNNLGTILATLKGSLCLDLGDAQFDESVRRVVAAIENCNTERKS